MIEKLALTLVAVSLSQFALADGTIEVPANARFQEIKIKTEAERWKPIDIPKVRKRTISLPPGEYSYVITIKSASGSFRGTLDVSDNSYHYIHRAITPDNKKVYSWASESKPRSEAYEIESQERFCMGVVGYGDKQQYMIDACAELVEANNTKGLIGTAYIHEKGLGGKLIDLRKASEYYMRAYVLGEQDGGVSYFMLHQDEPKGVEVLLELASEGHAWSIGTAGQVLARSQDPEKLAQSRRFAEQSLSLLDPIGYKTLSYLAFTKEREGTEYLIEAAAWFNLFQINDHENRSGASRFKSALEEAMLLEDGPAIVNKTIEFERDHVNSGYYLLVDTSVLAFFKDEGELSLEVGNGITMPVTTFEQTYALELLPSDSYYSVTLDVDELYKDSTTFLLGDSDDRVHCLSLRPDDNSLQTTTHSENEACPQAVEGVASMWEVLNQYQ